MIGALKRLSLRLLVTTDTLDSDIAALASTGDIDHPVTGYKTPAATVSCPFYPPMNRWAIFTAPNTHVTR